MKKVYVFSMLAVLFCGGTVFAQVKPKPKTESEPILTPNIVGGSNTTIDTATLASPSKHRMWRINYWSKHGTNSGSLRGFLLLQPN